MWMTKIRASDAKPAVPFLAYAQDTFCIPDICTLTQKLHRLPQISRQHCSTLQSTVQPVFYISTYHTYEYNFTGHCFVHLAHTYHVPGILRYVVYGTWCFTGIYLPNISRLCSSGYVRNIPGVFTPGITLQRTSVCLKDIHTHARNFCKFCTTFMHVPGTSVSSLRPCHKYPGYYGHSIFIPARNLCEFCTPVPQYPELL